MILTVKIYKTQIILLALVLIEDSNNINDGSFQFRNMIFYNMVEIKLLQGCTGGI